MRRLNAPNQGVWLVAVILGVIGILGYAGVISASVVVGNAFWLVAIAFGLLALATMFRGT